MKTYIMWMLLCSCLLVGCEQQEDVWDDNIPNRSYVAPEDCLSGTWTLLPVTAPDSTPESEPFCKGLVVTFTVENINSIRGTAHCGSETFNVTGTKVSSNVNFTVYNNQRRAQYTGVTHTDRFMDGDWSLVESDYQTMIGHYTFIGER